MAGPVLLVLIAYAACFVALVVVGVKAAVDRPEATGASVATAVRRHETLISLGAAVASATVVLALAGRTDLVWTSGFEPVPRQLGTLVVTSPFLGAVVFCLARAAGELLWPRPRGTVRTAPLARRSVRRLGGRRLGALVATTVLGLAAVTGFGLTATPDGRHVRHVGAVDAQRDLVGVSGPYPGWPFGVPVAAGLLLVLVAALLALVAVTRRPPLALLPREHDDAVRRTSAARVVAGAQAWVGSALGLMAITAAHALDASGRTGAGVVVGLAGAAVAAGSLVLAVSAMRGARIPAAARPVVAPEEASA